MNIDRVELEAVASLQQRTLGGKGLAYYGAVYSGQSPEVEAGKIPPWIQQPEGHVPFDEQGVALVPAVGVGVVVMTFAVPQGYDGVIEYHSVNYAAGGFVNGSGDLIWTYLADGRAIKNYDAIVSEQGTLQIPRMASKIRIYSGQVIIVQVFHAANAALGGNTIATMIGYYYPRKGQ